MASEAQGDKLAPMDFSTFVISLASSVMVYLGQGAGQDDSASDANLPMASQTIDILVMLQEKTQGNLTAEETKLLADILYQVRMAYLEAKRAS